MNQETQTRLIVANAIAITALALAVLQMRNKQKKVYRACAKFVNTYETAMTDITFRDIIRKNF